MGSEGQAKELFNEAMELPEPERAAFLSGACGGDAVLLVRVQRLLAAHRRGSGFLASPTSGAAMIAAAVQSAEQPGTAIGRYKLLELIGEGGFGSVFMAEQREPVRRRVALKVIKLGMDTRQVIARFEAERQALAMMDHPGIARVLDAGATETGRPYFVMELVCGEPITQYCDRHGLTIARRLELFQEVCQAVQHAHQKGVIHRDLKPSNVLVVEVDGRPAPKIIDFGIAKATGGAEGLTDRTLFTDFRQFLGTPEYMSPEQAQMGAVDIDTRSDIYSLGVLLYELLAGAPPFDPKRLRSAAWDEMRRIIREDEPQRPSTRLHTLATAAEVAAQRGSEASRLRGQVRGDLDWIVMKCLDKDRGRRYETASGLAMDIARHLRGEPVLAAPPSVAYRIGKFIRRNRVQVIAAAVVGISLLAAVVGTGTFAVRAARRAEDTRLIAEFQEWMLRDLKVWQMGQGMRQDVLDHAEQGWRWSSLSQEQIAAKRAELEGMLDQVNFTSVALKSLDQTIFDRTLAELDSRFEGRPLLKAQMLHGLAVLLGKHGLTDRARAALQEALDIRRARLDERHVDVLQSHHAIGELLARNHSVDAEAHARAALAGRTRVLGPDHLDTLSSTRLLGFLLIWQSRLEEAEPLLLRALKGFRRSAGDDDRETLVTMRRLGQLYIAWGRLDRAEPYFVEGLERAKATLPPEDGLATDFAATLGNVRLGQDRPADAYPLFRTAAEGYGRLLGEDHADTLMVRGALGMTLMELGRFEEAEAEMRAVMETQRRVAGEGHVHTISSIRLLGQMRWRQALASGQVADPDKLAEAEAYMRRALDGYQRAGLQTTPVALWTADHLAQVLELRGRSSEATATRSQYARGALNEFLSPLTRDIVGRSLGQGSGFVEWRGGPKPEPIDDPFQTGLSSRLYVLIAKTHDEGELVRQFLQVHGDTYGPANPRTFSAIGTLAWYLWAAGRYGDAERLAAEAVAGFRAMPEPPPDRPFANALCTLALAIRDRGRPGEALLLFEEVEPLIERDSAGAVQPPEAWIQVQHAACLTMLGRFEEAERRLISCHESLAAAERPDDRALRLAGDALTKLYDDWHSAVPGGGHDARTAEWRSRVSASRPGRAPPRPDEDEAARRPDDRAPRTDR